MKKRENESLREFEDRLINYTIEQKDKLASTVQSYNNLIATIEKKVDLEVIELLRAAQLFEKTRGFKDLLSIVN